MMEEMRRESDQALRDLLATSRPLPGVALPRPADPRPGDFFALMEQKQAEIRRQELVKAVGYDPRYLLNPPVKKVEAAPAVVPLSRPKTARPAVLHLPGPKIAGLLPATVAAPKKAPLTCITFMDRPVDFIRWEDKKKQLVVVLPGSKTEIVWNAGYLIKAQGTEVLRLGGYVPEWAKAVTPDGIEAIMRVLEEAVPRLQAGETERVNRDLLLEGRADMVLLVHKQAGRALAAGMWGKCVLRRQELRAFLINPQSASVYRPAPKREPREVVAAHVNGEIRSRLDYWNKRGKGPAGGVLTLDCGLVIKPMSAHDPLLWLLDPNDQYGRRAEVGKSKQRNPATGQFERWIAGDLYHRAVHELARQGVVKLIEAVTEEVPF
jgi:hypothetical protein